MLTAYRLHGKHCTRHAPRLDRSVKNCDCSIHVEGMVGGEMVREALHTTNWRKASLRVLKAETDGFWTPPEAPPEPTRLSLREAVTQFLNDLRGRGAGEHTIRKFRGALEGARREGCSLSLLEYAKDKGILLLDRVTLADLREWREGWSMGRLAARKTLPYVRNFFAFCVKAEWINKSPATALESPRLQDSDKRATLPFGEDELCSLYAALPKLRAATPNPNNGHSLEAHFFQRLEVLLRLLESSGLRAGDAISLATSQLDGDRLFLRRQEKTGTPVFVPLPPSLCLRLRELPLLAGQRYFWGGAPKLSSAYALYRTYFLRLCRLGEVANGHFHRFRDTFAVALLQEGVSIEHVSKLLGHRNTRITEEHYWPWVPALQQKLEEDVRRVWKSKGIQIMKNEKRSA